MNTAGTWYICWFYFQGIYDDARSYSLVVIQIKLELGVFVGFIHNELFYSFCISVVWFEVLPRWFCGTASYPCGPACCWVRASYSGWVNSNSIEEETFYTSWEWNRQVYFKWKIILFTRIYTWNFVCKILGRASRPLSWRAKRLTS
jgi:hypothetical protein